MQPAVTGEICARDVAAVVHAVDFRLQSTGNIHSCEFPVDEFEAVDHAVHTELTGWVAADLVRTHDFAKVINAPGNSSGSAGHIDGYIAEIW